MAAALVVAGEELENLRDLDDPVAHKAAVWIWGNVFAEAPKSEDGREFLPNLQTALERTEKKEGALMRRDPSVVGSIDPGAQRNLGRSQLLLVGLAFRARKSVPAPAGSRGEIEKQGGHAELLLSPSNQG